MPRRYFKPNATESIPVERVRWFADYHAKHPSWGVFHVALDDGNYECGAADPADVEGEHPADVQAMIDWFDDLTPAERESLALRVRALEQVRAQNTRGGGRADALAAVVRGGHSGAVPAGIAQAAERELQRMSTAATSLASLTLEAATGRLHQRQQQALAALRQVFANELDNGEQVPGRRVGPATTGEVISRRGLGGNVNLWRARFTELAHLGAIVKRGTRRCDITGRECMTWAPAAFPWTPPADRRQTPAELRAMLREAADVIDEGAQLIEPQGVDKARQQAMLERALVYRRAGEGARFQVPGEGVARG